MSSELRTDDSGQVIGISQHDGQIRALFLPSDGQVELRIVSSDGEEAKVTLLGVEYLALNNLREGNIVDRMYLWELSKTPKMIMGRMLKALAISSKDALSAQLEDDVNVFHLECSYGAELFAVVRCATSN